ncbi:MAG: methyltransferase domain-containing protein [Candidatus Pacebacteria bacterium]|nr:methyltransferase domain-containing protein [Candidatus Paceibacterota bacterium]
MNNKKFWDNEYKDPQILSINDEPQSDVIRFIKWLRKDMFYDLHEKQVLDLGCGTGRNIRYLASEFNCSGYGYDFSNEAIKIAQNNLANAIPRPSVVFEERSIGDVLPLADNSIDIVLDITSSNSLSPDERNIYLAEVSRVLKPGGYFFVRTLTRDGDRNAQNLLSMFPGEHYDTYVHPDLGITERVFREKDFCELYEMYFDVLFLKKQTGYQRRGSQSYKRRYLVAYLTKRAS